MDIIKPEEVLNSSEHSNYQVIEELPWHSEPLLSIVGIMNGSEYMLIID